MELIIDEHIIKVYKISHENPAEWINETITLYFEFNSYTDRTIYPLDFRKIPIKIIETKYMINNKILYIYEVYGENHREKVENYLGRFKSYVSMTTEEIKKLYFDLYSHVFKIQNIVFITKNNLKEKDNLKITI